MMTTTPNSGLLTIEQAAAALPTTTIAIRRLLARRQLAGTLVGKQWLIDNDTLRQYVTRGAADFTMPDLRTNWFARERLNQSRFGDTVRSLIGSHVPAEIPERFIPTVGDTVDIPITIYPQFNRQLVLLLDQTVPPSAVRLAGSEPDPRNFRDVFLSEHMRSAAWDVVQKVMRLGGPLEKLYDSPEEYDRITSEAWQRMQEQNIAVRRTYEVESRFIHVYFMLPFSTLAAGRRDAVLAMAF